MERERRTRDNVVFIGKKPSMAYVLAVVTQMSNNESEVVLKARGRAISKAVDVAEIVKNKFVPDIRIDNIRIGTEELKGENDEKINVSIIELTLKK